MIKPTDADVGRHVIYTPYGDYENKKIEEGVITSYNDKVVFVRYGRGSTSAATDPACALTEAQWRDEDKSMDAHFRKHYSFRKAGGRTYKYSVCSPYTD